MWKGIGRRWRWSRRGGGEYKGGNRGGSCLYAEGVGGFREVVSTRAETRGVSCLYAESVGDLSLPRRATSSKT